FLGQLIDKFTGGNVFICEAFFVTTREMPSIKFGTSIGDVQDPQTKLRIRLMVHGEFSAKVIDPVKLLIGLVGQRNATNEGFLPWFKSQVQKTMKDGIAELIVKQNWPLMKVTSGAYTEEIETTTLANVRKNIEPYGVEIIRFGDFSISMDQADKDRLDKLVDRMAYVDGMGSVNGGMAAYQQLAQAEMMMGAAEGMKKGGDGGGAAFQGAGIGMGFAMANNMGGMMGQGASAQRPVESREQIMSTLKQLGELKAAGILTEAEFDVKKKELLAKL
ncbi:MAG: SPFH domain-containing protein, partial [Kofleriaceae bacterium]